MIARTGGITTYEGDGFAADVGEPLAVVLPQTTLQVSQVMKVAQAAGVPVMPRGAGTSRCGGAIPLANCLVISTSRMKSVINFDPLLGHIRVQPGVTNLAISERVRPAGWFYAPDPSSRRTCTIGGNIASNSSGACAVRHGVTSHHLLGLTAVLYDGELVELGERGCSAPSYDLTGFLCGSEGQLALVTEATLRLEPIAEYSETLVAGFASNEAALNCASEILYRRLRPFRLEFMDRKAVALTEGFAPSGYPLEAKATLLVELQGFRAEVQADLQLLKDLAHRHGASSLRHGMTADEDVDLWAGRNAIYGAASQFGSFELLDCCVPLSKLNVALDRVEAIASIHTVEHATVAHVGDGTLHTFLLHAGDHGESTHRAVVCGDEIRAACVELGGTISSKYGVGLGRRDLLGIQFSATDLDQQLRTRAAFSPGDWLNPGKVFISSATAAIKDTVFQRSADGERLPNGLRGILTPDTEEVACDIVRDFSARRARLRIVGGGTRPFLSMHREASPLSSRSLTGITCYEPNDFVVTARAGTSLSELSNELALNGQRLAFEPPDYRLLFGSQGRPTIGAVAATNLSGPRRPFSGAARDSVLGLRLVNGRGEIIRCGARTIKNVAGLDLAKLIVGSQGSLGLITEVSFKVEAVPDTECTLAIDANCAELPQLLKRVRAAGIQACAGSYLCPRTVELLGIDCLVPGREVTLIRVEGRESNVRKYVLLLRALLEPSQSVYELGRNDSIRVWQAVRDLEAFAGRGAEVRRIEFPEGSELDFLKQPEFLGDHQVQLDWYGRQLWIVGPQAPELAPRDPGQARLQALNNAVKRSFDPQDVFDADFFECAKARQDVK